MWCRPREGLPAPSVRATRPGPRGVHLTPLAHVRHAGVRAAGVRLSASPGHARNRRVGTLVHWPRRQDSWNAAPPNARPSPRRRTSCGRHRPAACQPLPPLRALRDRVHRSTPADGPCRCHPHGRCKHANHPPASPCLLTVVRHVPQQGSVRLTPRRRVVDHRTVVRHVDRTKPSVDSTSSSGGLFCGHP